jgi:hypothetical protein
MGRRPREGLVDFAITISRAVLSTPTKHARHSPATLLRAGDYGVSAKECLARDNARGNLHEFHGNVMDAEMAVTHLETSHTVP